jgi:hypothetical protein
MNNRKFKTDKSTLIQEGKQIVNTTEDGKYIRKVTLVNLMLRGRISFPDRGCCRGNNQNAYDVDEIGR